MKNEDEKININTTRRSRFNFRNNRLSTAPPPEPRHRETETRSYRQPHLGGHKNAHTEKSGPLIFNVASLLRDYEGAHRDYDFEQDKLPLDQDGEQALEATNIEGHVRLTKVRHDILAQGQGQADVRLECVRCLNDFSYHADFDLEEVYRPSIDINTGLAVKAETEDEEDNLKLDANHLLNLGEALRQQILVSLPIKPICGEDCPGLLSHLERVNQGETAVEPEAEVEDEETPVDKRWAALSKLLQDNDQEK